MIVFSRTARPKLFTSSCSMRICNYFEQKKSKIKFKMSASIKHALNFKIVAECSTSKARTAVMTLTHAVVDTPVFMPVGTQGTLKGLAPEQLEDLGCRMMLGNTYHLGNRPVSERTITLYIFYGFGGSEN